MKKILITALALALPALASAQVALMSGYNFGQFLGAGYPSLDGTTGDPVGSIGANFAGTSQAPSSSSGDIVGNNGTTGNYSNGSGRLYWDGTNGSSAYDFSSGIQIVSTTAGGPNAVNGQTVHGYSLAFQGDNLNQKLTTNLNGGALAFVQNTLGYVDYIPVGPLDANLSFAASVTAPVTISWFLNGSATAFATTNLSGSTMATYTVDLPTGFYGLSAAKLVAQFSGAATLDNVQFNGMLVPVPEPSTYAAIFGLVVAGAVVLRRRNGGLMFA